MNFLTETVRMFFAVIALVLVGLLSTPQLDLNIANPLVPAKSSTTIASQKNQLSEFVEKAKPFVGPQKPVKSVKQNRKNKKIAEQRKAPKKVILLKRS